MKPYANHPLLRTRFQPHVPSFTTAPFVCTPPAMKSRSEDVKNVNPATNVITLENGFRIQLAVPGVPKHQIQIQVVENQLIISATNDNQETIEKFVRQEFDYSRFKKTFTLHKNADVENMKASFDQGVLTITIMHMTPETRKIEIV